MHDADALPKGHDAPMHHVSIMTTNEHESLRHHAVLPGLDYLTPTLPAQSQIRLCPKVQTTGALLWKKGGKRYCFSIPIPHSSLPTRKIVLRNIFNFDHNHITNTSVTFNICSLHVPSKICINVYFKSMA